MIKSLFVVAAALAAAPVLAQSPAMAPEAPARPYCSATITDGCQQTAAQQARAMTGAQADARDARAGGGWAPDKQNAAATAAARKKK